MGASIRASLQTMLLRPHRFLLSKPFALIFALYTGTYLTANVTDTMSSTVQGKPASSTTSGLSKFAATSTANITLCVYKDSCFTQMFGKPGASPRPVPTPSYILFTARDCLTIFASFNLPPMIAPSLPMQKLPEMLQKNISSASAAQFLTPAAVQIVSTPLHLLGLDLYNRSRVSWASRWQKIRSEWTMSCLARMGRIVPAFGVGGVVNAGMRKKLMGTVE